MATKKCPNCKGDKFHILDKSVSVVCADCKHIFAVKIVDEFGAEIILKEC